MLLTRHVQMERQKVACIFHVSDRVAIIIRRAPEINGPQNRTVLTGEPKIGASLSHQRPRKTRSCMRSSLSRSPKATSLVRGRKCVQRKSPLCCTNSAEASGCCCDSGIRRCTLHPSAVYIVCLVTLELAKVRLSFQGSSSRVALTRGQPSSELWFPRFIFNHGA